MNHDVNEITRMFKMYGDPIFKYIYMIIRDYQEAQDLTQETFLKAYTNLKSFKQINEKAWLYSIAHNVTVDFIKKRRPFTIMDKILEAKKDPDRLPEEQLEMKEDMKELYKALGNIKANYREVIILRKIKGFSTEETSSILNWSESKVKTTLHRAMKHLENELTREGQVYEKIN